MSYIETAQLRPGDIVRCIQGHNPGRQYLIEAVCDGRVWLVTLKMDWKPDARFMTKSGVFKGHLWRLVHRSGQ